MEVIDAIYKRRAIRSYTNTPVTRVEVHALLQAAVHAPSANNAQPWAFAIIQEREILKHYSEQAKAHLLTLSGNRSVHQALHHGQADSEFNIFYNAGTLIIVCATNADEFARGDCCLAAQNLMLAASAVGLGTCPIGFALPWLRLPETKQELYIPLEYQPVLPIIVGHPMDAAPPPLRSAPEIVSWLEA